MAAERNDKRKKPMEEVLKRFDGADEAFASFIKDNGSHPRILDAKLTRGKLLQDKAEYVKACLELGWAPASGASNWQKQMADWFDQAIQLFDAAQKKAADDRDELKRQRKDSGDAWDEATDQLAVVWLYRIAALKGKGEALPKGDPTGTAALTQAIKEGSDDYQWEFGSTVRGLWAIHYAGLAAALLDKTADTFNYLHTAASANAEDDNSPAMQEITFQSFKELGKACLAFGRRDKDNWPAKAIEEFAHMAQAWPEWKKHPEGQRAGLVWSSLLAQSGQGDKALALVESLCKAADQSNSNARGECTAMLGKLMTGGGGGGTAIGRIDPETATKIAMNKWRESDFNGAVRGFQAVVANCDEREEWDKFGWSAWDYIGRSYGIQGRWFEAFLAFDQIEQAWRKDKVNEKLSSLTDETGWSRAGALDQLSRQTKDAEDKAAAKRALDEFTNDHPGSARNLGGKEAAAATALRDAEGSRSDPDAYKAACAAALKLYSELDAASKTADKNKATIAQILQKMGEFDKAIAAADEWLAQKRPETTDSLIRRSREEGRRIVLAVALTGRAEKAASLARSPDRAAAAASNQDLLTSLDKYGPEFKDIASNGAAQIDQWRAEGLIGTGKVDDADQLVGKLLESNPAGRNNAYLCAIIGLALERAALDRRDNKGDEVGYRQLMIRSARRREWVLDNQKTKDGAPAPRNPDVIRTVGDAYADGGDFGKAEALLTEAQKAYDELAAAGKDDAEKDKNVKKSRTCRIELIGLLVKQAKFDAAIPQLEKEIAKDPKERDAFLKKIQTTDAITDADFKKLLDKTDANKALLDQLSVAYMKAPSKDRLFAAANLSYILNLTMAKDERHGSEYIDFLLRRGEAYLMLAEFTRLPEHYKQASATVRNSIIIPGNVESYEATRPGSKKRGDILLQKAEEGLRKVGVK
ncbi:MAG: hypothetical protein K8T90_11830 [Planctomycetes bacterium]|nr:hypothetical protein [Planctomycetota bacterium]